MVGWYGAGVLLHDHTDAANGGQLGLLTVGTNQLRIASGSAVGGGQIALNARTFFPSITNAIAAGGLADNNAAPPSDFIARFSCQVSANENVRWEYLTASDNPTIWIAYDPVTVNIKGTWCSDDPLSDGSPGIVIPGCVSIMLKAADLGQLPLPASDLAFAEAYISANKLRPAHLLYRALQLHTGDQAPARWLFDNCKLDPATTVLQIQPIKAVTAALDVQPVTPTLMQKLWNWISS